MPWVPTDLAGLKLWLKADQISGSDGDLLSTWTDQSTNGKNATAAGAARPTYKVNIQNDLAVVRFDGAATFMTTADISVTQPNSIYVVAKQTSTATMGTFFDGTSTNPRQTLRCESGSGVISIYGGTAVRSGTINRSAAFRVFSLIVTGGNGIGYAELLSDTGAAGSIGTQAIGPVSLGAYSPAGVGQLFLNGDIAEVLVYDTAVSVANHEIIEDYLRQKWAVLPIGATTGYYSLMDGGGSPTSEDGSAASGATVESLSTMTPFQWPSFTIVPGQLDGPTGSGSVEETWGVIGE